MPIQVGVAGGVLMSSSNTTSISPVVTDTFLDAGLPGATAGILLNHVTYSTTATAKSGDKATLTFSHVNSLGATITATQDVTVGGSSTKGVNSNYRSRQGKLLSGRENEAHCNC